MAMVRFKAFSPRDHEIVKRYEAAAAATPEKIDPDLAEQYRSLVKDNFGKLMSTMIGEVARFFDIAIKRKYDWNRFYGWTFGFHGDTECWYGISYAASNFLQTCFAVKHDPAKTEVMARLADEGYRQVPFGKDGTPWLVKEFVLDLYPITDDEAQMVAISKIAEDQLDLLEE